jgi:DNA-binding transcriptional regulator PaaX
VLDKRKSLKETNMAQILSPNALHILKLVKQGERINIYSFIKDHFKNDSYRKIYTHVYQLEKRGYLEKYKDKGVEFIRISPKGEAALESSKRVKDGKWKMIIFDIPETQRPVRDYLRTKLKQLGFKRWQNSIWVTPYKLPDEVISELKILSEKFFVRLIWVDKMNNDSDLKDMF